MVACYDSEECVMRDCTQCPRYSEQFLKDPVPKTKKNTPDNDQSPDTKPKCDLSDWFE